MGTAEKGLYLLDARLTLLAEHPSFNPYAYQNGAVWPHDSAIIAVGFRRYGFASEAAQIARDISGAAGHFLLNQPPEPYAGMTHARASVPVQYLGALGGDAGTVLRRPPGRGSSRPTARAVPCRDSVAAP